jgi:phosphotransferase system IIB component
MGRRNIARTLEKRGVLRKDGKPLSEMNIRGILTSPKYYGTVVLHTDETNFNLKKRVKVPESEWIYIEDALPAIINKELFDKVNKVTKESSIKCSVDYSSRDMSKVGKHKLSGKLICGCCGSVYYRYQPKNRNGIKLKQWKCSKAIMNGKTTSIGCNNRNLYEHNIYNAIEEACKKHYNFIYTSNDNIIDELLNTIKQVISNDTSQVELNSLNKELSKQKGRKNILFDKLMNQVISDSDFKMYNDKISENISDIENRISKIESKSINIKEYEERLTKIRESLNDDSIISEAKTSELIDRIDKIIVYDKIIQIIFNKDKMGELVSIYDSLNEHELDEKYYIINIECSSLTENDLKLQNKRNETNKRILEYFRNNPKLTLKELYKLLDCKESYINTSVWQLEKQGKLKKIRHGIPASEWLVIDN